MSRTRGKYFLKIIFDIKIKIGILVISELLTPKFYFNLLLRVSNSEISLFFIFLQLVTWKFHNA